MREEDIDWTVYHTIVSKHNTSLEELNDLLSFSREDIESSVERLERKCLIGRRNGKIMLLSIQEMMITNRLRNARDLPFTIEGGVIKVKSENKEK
jgi:hypothetical protein